jgi:alpha-L-arabinofuranosidase
MELLPTGACRPEASGGYLLELLAPTVARPDAAGSESGAAVVNVDFVTLHPGEWGRFHGQPVRKDLATMLFDGMGVPLLRFGGGTINARQVGDDDAKNATGWGLGYSWRYMRGPRWQRPPMEFVNPNVHPARDQISYASNGFGVFEFLDLWCHQPQHWKSACQF